MTASRAPSAAKTALVFGATGLIGAQLVRDLLASPDYAQVIAVVRRPLALADPKLTVLIGDLDRLPALAAQLKADEVFIALGTTRKQTPDEAEYYRIDHDYPVAAARIALAEKPHLKSRLGSATDASGMLDSHTIVVSAAAPGRAMLAIRMGLFSTDDHGASWHDMEVGRFSPLTYCRSVIVSPHDPRVLYACLSTSSRGKDGSLWRSDDVGATWQRVDRGVKADATMMSGSAPTPLTTRPACCSRTVTSPCDSVLPPVMALTEYSSISAPDCTTDSMACSVASTGPLPSLSARCS